MTCKITDCTRKSSPSRGMCWPHYRRWLNFGDPKAGTPVYNGPADRFWTKVKKGGADECWEWQGFRTSKGYGRFGDSRESSGYVYAHRYSSELATGKQPGSKHVLHHCDNPPCVNPAHLFLGTNRDNSRDAVNKGRIPRGNNSAQAKLTEDQVVAIRHLYSKGHVRYQDVADAYGVKKETIYAVVARRNWRWL
jgi:hypothetical protein